MTLEVASSERDETVTLVVRGDIDMSTAGLFRRALDEAPAGGRLVLDFTQVRYLDSAGVKVLFDHLGRRPELVVDPDAVILRVLAITGLRDRLTIRDP